MLPLPPPPFLASSRFQVRPKALFTPSLPRPSCRPPSPLVPSLPRPTHPPHRRLCAGSAEPSVFFSDTLLSFVCRVFSNFGAAPDLTPVPPGIIGLCVGAPRHHPDLPLIRGITEDAILVSARLPKLGHDICPPWPRSCDRQPFEPAVLACAAGRAKPNVSMRAAGPPARTAQRACTTATCRPTR